jgi:outer membrane protein OmpA-like peptidoglycan-associated protein
MNHNRKSFVLALILGLTPCGCMKKAEPAKPEGTASARMGPTAASGDVKPTVPVAAGFDISKVPIVDPPLGRFPYVSLIEGYQPNRSDDNKDVAFDRYEFFDGTKLIPIEGQLKTVAAEGRGASAFQVFKTYESLMTGLGGVRVFEGTAKAMKALGMSFSEMRHRHPVFDDDQMGIYMLRTPEREIWLEAYVAQYKDNSYFLTVVEKKALEVKATLLPAEEMKKELDAKGHVALYINFDFDKADIKPESQPIIDEVGKLLKTNPNLNLTIEGHTDNTGTPDYNRRLSDARARSVVAALMAQGIATQRLTAVGYGQDKPIADNHTDAGRAKNRRVELVKVG